MKSVKIFNSFISSVLVLTAFSLSSAEPVCHRCEEIREYNAEHHENFEYYDDYVKLEKNEKSTKLKTSDDYKNNNKSTGSKESHL